MSGVQPGGSCRKRQTRSGTTLVEVLVSCLILAVIAVGTGACLSLSRTGAAVQRNRRTAMELANSRMEEIRGALYAAIVPPVASYDTYYLDFITGAWRVSATDQGETVTLGGRSRPMVTTVQYMDVDGGPASYDCLRISVSVQYRDTARDAVTLQTVRSP